MEGFQKPLNVCTVPDRDIDMQAVGAGQRGASIGAQ
jgi:hypothetical protein